jgi:uncharacterized protein involved in oxidation of intracellular sulfur
MKLGIIIYSVDPETVWNAMRLGLLALSCGDEVNIFLLAQGVENDAVNTEKFPVVDKMEEFVKGGGKILSCGTCLSLRDRSLSPLCQTGTMGTLYDMISGSDKIISI